MSQSGIRIQPKLKPKVPSALIAKPKRQRLTVDASPQDPTLQSKIAKIAELHAGLAILRDRMSQSKRDLISYFDRNPHLKTTKYPVGTRMVRYVDKKVNDGLSQKLLIRGLSEYFRQSGESNIEGAVAQAMATILSHRGSKIVPGIDITNINGRSIDAPVDSDDDGLEP